MTCTICGNAHTGECSVAALKAQIAALSKDPDTIPRHLLFALSQAQRAFERRDRTAFGAINEHVQPVADAVLGWIREVERERDALAAKIAALNESTVLLYADREALWRVVRDACAVLRVTDDAEEDWPKLTAAVTSLLAERNTLRAQLATTREDVAASYDRGMQAGDETYERQIEELRAQLAEAKATIARLNRRAH